MGIYGHDSRNHSERTDDAWHTKLKHWSFVKIFRLSWSYLVPDDDDNQIMNERFWFLMRHNFLLESDFAEWLERDGKFWFWIRRDGAANMWSPVAPISSPKYWRFESAPGWRYLIYWPSSCESFVFMISNWSFCSRAQECHRFHNIIARLSQHFAGLLVTRIGDLLCWIRW